MVNQEIDIHPLLGQQCDQCKQIIYGGKALFNWILGHIDTLYCIECLAIKEHTSIQELIETMHLYMMSRPCFQQAWDELESIKDNH